MEKTSTDLNAKIVQSLYGYTSREWEQENGDYYYRFRNYDPRTGRFLSEDPIGFDSGDFNLYRYVKNNPVIMTDPDGLFPHPADDGATNPVNQCVRAELSQLKMDAVLLTMLLSATSSTSLGACAVAGPAAPACIRAIQMITGFTGGTTAVACVADTVGDLIRKCVDAHLKQGN